MAFLLQSKLLITASISYYLLFILCFFIFTLFIFSFLLQSQCGRWSPNAWPSPGMLEKSKYMRSVVGRPASFYVALLFEKAPLHLLGMIYGLLYFFSVLYQACSSCARLSERQLNSDSLEVIRSQVFTTENIFITMLTLISWAVLLGHTLLGFLGGGSQTRFIALVTPAASMLIGHCLAKSNGGGFTVAVTLLVAMMSMYTLYYGILYAPLFSDLDYSIFGVMYDTILQYPYHSIQSPECGKDLTQFMSHYGLKM
mgnify:CR=1 FL=1